MTLSLQTRLSDLITSIGTDYKTIKGWIGDLTTLSTTSKTSLVSAINEVYSDLSGATVPNATTAAPGIIEIATLTEVATGTDAVRAVTPEGVRQERTALKAEILNGAPSALDTLKELADALGDDASYASSITTALGYRVRVDTNAQGLTSTQQGNARTNINVYSKAELGDPETDLAALYTTAKS